jgi:uncharacterized GH25 family protein
MTKQTIRLTTLNNIPAPHSKSPLARLLAAAALILSAPPLFAHDAWIEPSAFHPATGAIVGARQLVGRDRIGDPLPRNDSLIKQYIVADIAGRRPLVGHDGADPAGLLRVNAAGLLVIGYDSNPSTVEETPEKFAQYLTEEGLETIAAERARRGETGAVRELFSRCAKSLVLAGPTDAAQGDRALGFTLELVAERNPYVLHAGEELPVRLTYEDAPLAGALVVAINRDDPSGKLSARSDSEGRVRLRLPRGGMWLIKAVHMIRAPSESGADWESFWASLTFDLQAEADATTVAQR